MTKADDLAMGSAGGLIGFDIAGLVHAVDNISQTAIVKSGTAGDMHVEPDVLVQFYNDLSQLHTMLRAKMDAMHTKAVTAHEQDAGGLLPGAKDAWIAITTAAGALKHANSLYGNLLSVDHLVLSHMNSLKQSLDAYVENEGMAVVGFGKAATGGDAGSSGKGATPAAGTPITSHSM